MIFDYVVMPLGVGFALYAARVWWAFYRAHMEAVVIIRGWKRHPPG